MLILYSLLLTIAFIFMLPLFLLRREKYAAVFWQRLGSYPKFEHDARSVIWLHCVSVGETNAARPLVDAIRENFRDHRIVISTTTKTGQELAQSIYRDTAGAVFYFPFDFKFSVRKALANYKPSLVLLMETEIWPRFIREAKSSGAIIAIVNGRLSAKSFGHYSKIRPFINKVLSDVGLALMQAEIDSVRIVSLGHDQTKVEVTGNLKFDLSLDSFENEITQSIDSRFEISNFRPLIVAASTHSPEEKLLLEAYGKVCDAVEIKPRMLIAPRHPERFEEAAGIIRDSGFRFVRRSDVESSDDKEADVILLDSIGELRAVYPLADIVFVGGSLIPHGGQSILEPAAAGKAIITGPYTHNFKAVVEEFLAQKALIRLPEVEQTAAFVDLLYEAFGLLLRDPAERDFLGSNASRVMTSNQGATHVTIALLLKELTKGNG